MGSKLIHEIEYRMGFAFIGRKGMRGTAFEKSAKNRKDMVQVTQLFVAYDNKPYQDQDFIEKHGDKKNIRS